MKRFFVAAICVIVALSASAAPKAEKSKVNYVDATELTMLGKLCETTNPYHRVEVSKVEGITESEAKLLKMSSGLAIAFKTDATSIYVKAQYGPAMRLIPYAPLASTTGFNLFIKDTDGELKWAASKVHKITPSPENFA